MELRAEVDDAAEDDADVAESSSTLDDKLQDMPEVLIGGKGGIRRYREPGVVSRCERRAERKSVR